MKTNRYSLRALALLPDDATPEQRAGFDAGHGGALVPSLCVDKGLPELSSFDALAQEATQLNPAWRFVCCGALSGTAVQAPEAGAVDAALQAMVESIKRGDLGSYLTFDRQGVPVAMA